MQIISQFSRKASAIKFFAYFKGLKIFRENKNGEVEKKFFDSLPLIWPEEIFGKMIGCGHGK
jgi:hypothetical protein